jgi:tRNA1(Val) A37 N6-methylase TrmN6
MGAPEGTSRQTVDAFHRGAFWLVQPAGRGHRAGTDAMILAAAVPSGFVGWLADLGAGAGAAGLAVAARCPQATIVLVERSPEMAYFARRSLDHPGNAGLAARASLIVADVTLAGKARAAAGLDDRAFDFAIMNPPFNEVRDRPSPDGLKREAHVLDAENGIDAWVRTAAAIVRPRGGFAAILRPTLLPALLAAMAGRFGGAGIVPIHPRPDEPAIRVVVRAIRSARGALKLMPPLVLHGAGGHQFTTRADEVNNGRASLFGD